MNPCKVSKSHKGSTSGLEALKSMWGEGSCVHKASKVREWIHFQQPRVQPVVNRTIHM